MTALVQTWQICPTLIAYLTGAIINGGGSINANANINGQGVIDLADVSYLVRYLDSFWFCAGLSLVGRPTEFMMGLSRERQSFFWPAQCLRIIGEI